MHPVMANECISDEVAFLGDPRFPAYTIGPDSDAAIQIQLFTNLFQRYSKLGLSHPEDRPVAIDGLIHRLTPAFRTRSLAGLFETYWGRCLLWQRAESSKPLRKIPVGTHTKRAPPSWSWMAFEGAISFLAPDGGTVDWNDDNVIIPFAPVGTQYSWLHTSRQNDEIAIRAPAFEFATETSARKEYYLSYDDDQNVPRADMKCVIIGTEKQVKDAGRKKHYVMLVSRNAQASVAHSYERIGIGHLLGNSIILGNPESILIQ